MMHRRHAAGAQSASREPDLDWGVFAATVGRALVAGGMAEVAEVIVRGPRRGSNASLNSIILDALNTQPSSMVLTVRFSARQLVRATVEKLIDIYATSPTTTVRCMGNWAPTRSSSSHMRKGEQGGELGSWKKDAAVSDDAPEMKQQQQQQQFTTEQFTTEHLMGCMAALLRGMAM